MDYLEIRELYHHGIKGQKWGIRRFQNEDGTLTAEGKQRYGVDNNGKMSKEGKQLYKDDAETAPKGEKIYSAFRTQKIEKYVNQGLSAEDANKKYITRRNIAIGAGVVASAVAAYGTYKLVDYYKDTNIKSGKVIQRIAPSSEDELHDTFYAAVNKHDKKRYEAMLPLHYNQRGATGVVKKEIAANKNIKVASTASAKKVYNDLKKNNLLENRYSSYDNFNQNLARRNSDSKLFYSKLKELGYGGVVDMNDKKLSGYSTRKPIIFFEGKDSFNVMNTTLIKLDKDAYNKEYGKATAEVLASFVAKRAVPISAIAAGKAWIDSNNLQSNKGI